MLPLRARLALVLVIAVAAWLLPSIVMGSTFGFWSFKSAVNGATLRYTSGTFSLVPVAGRMVVGDFVGDTLEPAFVSKEGTSLFTYRWTNNVVSFADFTSYQLG